MCVCVCVCVCVCDFKAVTVFLFEECSENLIKVTNFFLRKKFIILKQEVIFQDGGLELA